MSPASLEDAKVSKNIWKNSRAILKGRVTFIILTLQLEDILLINISFYILFI